MSGSFQSCAQVSREPRLPPLFVRAEICPGRTAAAGVCSCRSRPAPDVGTDCAEELVASRFLAGEVSEELGLGRFCRPMSEAISFLPPCSACGVVCFEGGVAGFDEGDGVFGGGVAGFCEGGASLSCSDFSGVLNFSWSASVWLMPRSLLASEADMSTPAW